MNDLNLPLYVYRGLTDVN